MAASFNKVYLMGNLTRDPEVRTTPAGMAIAKFGLAVNRRYTTQQGEQREETTFVDIDAFGKQAETIQKFCRKGSGLFVEGRLKLDSWDDKNTGEKRSKLGVTLEGFQFIGGRSDGAGGAEPAGGDYEQSSPPPRASSPRPTRQAPPPAAGNVDDDVPF